MSMVTLYWIVHMGYLLWEHEQSTTNPNHTKATMQGQAPDTVAKTGTGDVIPGHNHIFTDTIAQVIMNHIEAVPGHDIGIITTTQGVAYNAQVPQTGIIAINLTITHHINPTVDHLHMEAHHHTTPKTEVAHIHFHPKILKMKFTFQQIMRQTTSQEEHQSENRRSTHRLLQF